MKEETAMADPAEMVTLELTFWHKGKVPGDRVEVRRDEVRSWYGFAKQVDEQPEPAKKADESAATGSQKTPEPADKPAATTATTSASKAK